jgi:Flp pilus assembly protein TadD
MRSWSLLFILATLASASLAQQAGSQSPPAQPPSQAGASDDQNSADQKSGNQAIKPDLSPPRSDSVRADDLGSAAGQSSSKDTQTDLAAPENDATVHPESSSAVAAAEAGVTPGGISEFHTWNPHQAAKSIEVGDFYFKRKNYKAAEERYREALDYKENDAVATIKLAVCLEKLGVFDDARAEYESYLKILPYGPEVGQAKKALERLKTDAGKSQ